jgi:Outer membrane protein beta-barrel domain
MKKLIIFTALILPYIASAQFGVKAGLNFANISSAKELNPSSHSGFHAGVFLSPSSKKLFSSRTELIFSRQGYNFKSAVNTGDVNLDYVILSPLLGINLTKFVQLQIGAQTAILVSAQAANTDATPVNLGGISKLLDLYNRYDYGYALGFELHPIKNLLISARYNVSLAKIYKSLSNLQKPTFTSADAKNNVIQLSAGFRFGGGK